MRCTASLAIVDISSGVKAVTYAVGDTEFSVTAASGASIAVAASVDFRPDRVANLRGKGSGTGDAAMR